MAPPDFAPSGSGNLAARVLGAILADEPSQYVVCGAPSCKAKGPLGRFWCSRCWATFCYAVFQYSTATMPQNTALTSRLLADQLRGDTSGNAEEQVKAAEAMAIHCGVTAPIAVQAGEGR